MEYQDFLQAKVIEHEPSGFEVDMQDLNPALFDWQKLVVRWCLFKGRAALFAGCGLGKTPMQLEWANHVHNKTGGNVLILAPLAVAGQTIREGQKFGIEVHRVRSQSEVQPGINVTNYEMVEHFDADEFAGVVLDESSILKAFMGKTKQMLISKFQHVHYKLCCTATPAPNDHVELGTHSEFLNVMSRAQMLSSWFVNDGFNSSQYRIKGHAREDFWRWISTWAVYVNKPSDLGYDDGGFALPELSTHEHIIDAGYKPGNGMLVEVGKPSATEMYKELRQTADARTDAAAELVNASDESWIVWCNTNHESELLASKIADAVEIKGSMSNQAKEDALESFVSGKSRVMVGKPSMCGFGLNLQHCRNMAFVGLSYSFEQRYQAIRRCWRFGQTQQVHDHVIVSPKEHKIFRAVQEKESKHLEMENEMQVNVSEFQELKLNKQEVSLDIKQRAYTNHKWKIVHGDCVEATKKIEPESIGFSIFSPPFSDLFVYSNSFRDIGNCRNDQEFFEHFKFLIPELYRVTIPGRLCAVHCSQLPRHKYKDGFTGLKDFRGDIIRAFEESGWVYHSEVCIWKDPVVEMQRTKAQGLLHKQITKDSTLCRQGMPDYLLVFRKHTDKPIDPVAHPNGFNPADYVGEDTACHTSIDVWQRYASPVWFDIQQSRVLNVKSARTDKDQRHLCPLQLGVIERAIHLWTNKDDWVLTPFAGVGSEVYSAVKMGRKGYGIELKEEYVKQALKNMEALKQEMNQGNLLELANA
jgi:DNA modification methylase